MGNVGFTLLCKPPGIFKDKQERKGMLTCIDIAVPSESNTSENSEKLSKDQDLEIEVNRMWETNKNNYAVEPILTANSPQWPPLYSAFFFSRQSTLTLV